MRRIAAFTDVLRSAVARRGAALMAVCNVTPDSFSDGGLYLDAARARARVDELVEEGADIIDIGGESTRPGAPAVPAATQIERVLPVLQYAVTRACVSVDTTSPEVARVCLEAGASIVNDVSCLRDPELASVVARFEAVLVLMHARGTQAEMGGFGAYPDGAYGDVVHDVLVEWDAAARRALALGVLEEGLVMDPGLGFAKNARHSFELLRRTREVVAGTPYPVLVGASRKSFLRIADEKAWAQERVGASVAAALYAARAGAKLLRVHDIVPTRQAIDLYRHLDASGTSPPRALPESATRLPFGEPFVPGATGEGGGPAGA